MDILIEVKKYGCTLVSAKTGGYIKSFAKLSTAEKKAKEFAKGGKISIKFIDQ